jgi:hypothetical protein
MTAAETSQNSEDFPEAILCYDCSQVKQRSFPRLSQHKMAAFLDIKQERLSWATRNGIVTRDRNGFYHPEVVVGQWLQYERKRSLQKSKTGQFEKQRVRLTRAKAEAAERQLALLDGSLVSGDGIIESVKTVCLRIKSKLQAALPRIARSCYHAPNVTEALKNARSEFDLVIGELSALENDGVIPQLEVVQDGDTNGVA